MLVGLTILGNSLNLVVPKIISRAIDSYAERQVVPTAVTLEFLVVALGIFIFLDHQSAAQTYASERVARDLRTRLVEKIFFINAGEIIPAGSMEHALDMLLHGKRAS